MKKDQVIILEKRGTVLIKGEEASDFLQNIITNDIKKASYKNSIFSALLTPQGKYLNEFESNFSKYIKRKNVFAVSSAAAALDIIALLLNLKKRLTI